MNKNLEKAKRLLEEKKYTCVLIDGEHILYSSDRGVSPLLKFVESKKDYSGFSAADKVIGKASAMLYIVMNVKFIYGKTISVSALEILKKHGVYVEYDILVDGIRNRFNTGPCPMENSVKDIDDLSKGVEAIIHKYKELTR